MTKFITTEDDQCINLDHIIKFFVARSIKKDKTQYCLYCMTTNSREYILGTFQSREEAQDDMDKLIIIIENEMC